MAKNQLLRCTILITAAAAWAQACILFVPPPPAEDTPSNPSPTQSPNPMPNIPLDPQPSLPLTSAPQHDTTLTPNETTLKIPTPMPGNRTVSPDSTTLTSTSSTPGHTNTHHHPAATNGHTMPTIPDWWWWWYDASELPSNEATVTESSNESEVFPSSTVSVDSSASGSYFTDEYHSDYFQTFNILSTSSGPDDSTTEMNKSTDMSSVTTLEYTADADLTATFSFNSMTHTDSIANTASTMPWLENDTYATNEFMETSISTSVDSLRSTDSISSSASPTFFFNTASVTFASTESTAETADESTVENLLSSDDTTLLSNIATDTPTTSVNSMSTFWLDNTTFSFENATTDEPSISTKASPSLSTLAFSSIPWLIHSLLTTYEPSSSEYHTDAQDMPAASLSTPLPNYSGMPGTDAVDQQDLTSMAPGTGGSDFECPPVKFKKPPVGCKDYSTCKTSDDCKQGYICCLTDPCGTKKCIEKSIDSMRARGK